MSNVITQVAEDVASRLVAGGVSLTFKSDSMLAPICGEVSLIAENSTDEPSMESLAVKVNDYFADTDPNPFSVSTENIGLGNTFFTGADAISDDILPLAVGIINVIKQSIIPATNEIFHAAYNATSENVDGGGVRLDIVTDGLEHPLFNNVALTSIIEGYAETGDLSATRATGLSFPELPTETLQTTVMAVNNSLNGDLQDLLGTDSETLLQNTYKAVFNVAGSTPVDWDKLYGQELKSKVIALLLAIGLSEEIPEGVVGVDDVGQYRALMRKVISCFALHVNNALKYTANLDRTGNLVRHYPVAGSEFTEGASIIVAGRQFNDWLELGGTVDAIYGAYVSDQRVNGAALLEQREQYERNWVRYIATKQSSMRDNFESLFVQNLRTAITEYAKEHGMSVKAAGIETMYERSSSIDSDNAYPFARRAVVHTLFEAGDNLTILENIDKIAEASPDIALEDAVDIATVEWLVDWALDQVKITRK